MGEREWIFDVADLPVITITCPTCRNLVSYNVDTTAEKFGAPLGCSVCSEGLGDALAQCFVAYRRFFLLTKQLDTKVQLRGRAIPITIRGDI